MWWIARAEGSIEAARGRKDVGESVWRCGGWFAAVVVVEGEVGVEEGRRWERRSWRRVDGGDIVCVGIDMGRLRSRSLNDCSWWIYISWKK